MERIHIDLFGTSKRGPMKHNEDRYCVAFYCVNHRWEGSGGCVCAEGFPESEHSLAMSQKHLSQGRGEEEAVNEKGKNVSEYQGLLRMEKEKLMLQRGLKHRASKLRAWRFGDSFVSLRNSDNWKGLIFGPSIGKLKNQTKDGLQGRGGSRTRVAKPESKRSLSGAAVLTVPMHCHWQCARKRCPSHRNAACGESGVSNCGSGSARVYEKSREALEQKEVWMVAVVCDGHDGAEAAEYTVEKLPMRLAQNLFEEHSRHSQWTEDTENQCTEREIQVLGPTKSDSVLDLRRTLWSKGNGLLDPDGEELESKVATLSLSDFPCISHLDEALLQQTERMEGGCKLSVEPFEVTEGWLFRVFEKAVKDIDHELRKVEMKKKKESSSGCCMIACMLTEAHLVLASVGDCRALIVEILLDKELGTLAARRGCIKRTTRGFFLRGTILNKEHRLDNLDELKRVNAKDPRSIAQNRLFGVLEPTRSIGDWDLKLSGTADVLISTPTVTLYRRNYPTLVVLGSDGIWDAVSIEKAMGVIAQHVEKKKITVYDKNNCCSIFVQEDLESMAIALEKQARVSYDDRTALLLFIRDAGQES